MSKTSEYYKSHPKARLKRLKAQKKINVSKRKFKIKSHKTGKMIQYGSDLKNRQREAKKNGKDTSKTDYDHTTKKRITKGKNRANKKKFMFKSKKK